MKKFLITLHRWLGVPLGLLFIVTFGTGCLTAVEELLQRIEHGRHNAAYSYRQTTSSEEADVLALIVQGKKDLRRIIMPTQKSPYYRISSRRESWTYSIDNPSQAVYAQTTNDGFFRTILQLHRNFLLGKEGLWGIEGKHYAAWVGLTSLLLSLLGLWIWWPLRKSFKVKDVVPRGKKRKHFYYSHMTSGVITLIAVVLLSLTGAAITYRSIAQNVFNVKPNNNPVLAEPLALQDGWESWLNAAKAQMPNESTLTQVRFPRQPRTPRQPENTTGKPVEKSEQTNNEAAPQLLEFRFITPGDWFDLSRSNVKIDRQTSMLVSVSHFKSLPLNEKFYSILVPLHTGHNLPTPYVVVLLLFSMLGTVMVLSGLVSFIRKKRKRLKLPRPISLTPAINQ